MFFNPLNRASADPNYKVLATAQMTITDQTDASNLAGNMTIINGSKSQAYLTGSAQPYNPNWKVNKLVLRPYMIATNVYRGPSESRYNPDLFDPKEYPNLETPGDTNVTTKYIHDIEWYIVDSANNQKRIDITKSEFSSKFSHTWQYGDRVIEDKRTLVIQDNILDKDQMASIVVKFAFHDPFADIRIPVAYEVQLNNLSTGVGATKTFINAIDGNSFYNADDNAQLRFEANYYREGVAVDLNKELSSGSSNLKVEWFIKSPSGWAVLDPTTQGQNEWKDCYEIRIVKTRDDHGNITETEKVNNAKGGALLIVKPGLIAGSDIIKLVVTDTNSSDMQSGALETIYDYSDPTQCYIHSSNGDKLYKGMNAPGTVLSTVVTYKGELFQSDDERYNTMFDYYWYRIDSRGDKIENVYSDSVGGPLQFIDTKNPQYTSNNGYPKSLTRSITIEPKHVENKATFSCDLLDKKAALRIMRRNALLRTMPLEDDIRDAQIALMNVGISKYDYEEIMATAIEMRAFAVAQEEQIIQTFNTMNRGE